LIYTGIFKRPERSEIESIFESRTRIIVPACGNQQVLSKLPRRSKLWLVFEGMVE
jgi:hypothetical protein